jgi:hypothetical protein
MLDHLLGNWKSTMQSVLTTTFAVTGVLMTSSVIKPHTAAMLVTANGIAKVVLGVFQSDGIQLPGGSTVTEKTTVITPK